MQLIFFLFPLQHMKRPALRNKQVALLRMAFRARKVLGTLEKQGPVSRTSRELFGPENPFIKVRSAYTVKLVFSCVVKGIKAKITAKFRASRRLRFEDTKRIMSPEIRRNVSGLSRNRPQGPGACFSKSRNFSGGIFKTKVSRVTKLCSYFNFYFLYNM